MDQEQTPLRIKRVAYSSDHYGIRAHEAPEITIGLLHLDARFGEFKKLLQEKSHLQLKMDDSHYENVDLFAMAYGQELEYAHLIDDEELYDLLSREELRELGGEKSWYSLELTTNFDAGP